MRVLNCLGNETKQVGGLNGIQAPILTQMHEKMVKTKCLGIMLIDQCRAAVMLLKFVRSQNSWMLNTLKQAELKLGRFFEPRDLFQWLTLGQINANLALQPKIRVQCQPILIGIGLVEQALKLIAAHTTHAHGLFNACLFYRARDDFGGVRSNLPMPPVLID